MSKTAINLLVVLGPTACGKTRLGVALARELEGEIISADSRQVYRGLNLGAGKDLDEYSQGKTRVPCHLIDIVDLDQEFSVFEFQRQFVTVFEGVRSRGVLPILVGGSGLYLESVLKGYRMVVAPCDPALRLELEPLSLDQLKERLRQEKEKLHNTSDFGSRERVIRAIEIARFSKIHPPEPMPEIKPLILGIRYPRDVLKTRIMERLRQRLDAGLVDEVANLQRQGISWERLVSLGLEYRFVSEFIQGQIQGTEELAEKLGRAIFLFAKRQESWFRRMERQGLVIHWLEGADIGQALELLNVRSNFARLRTSLLTARSRV